MRDAAAIIIEADDPIAPAELASLALQRDWDFALIAPGQFALAHRTPL
jgi:tRNA 2-thiouridine synthesizing protein A